jgi:uncharacterized repeat protein (TIGR01451 family)
MKASQSMSRFYLGKAIVFLLSPSLLWILATPPAAAQAVANSSAYGESVSLSVAPLVGNNLSANSGPLPQVAGTAAPAYSKTATSASAGASTSLTGPLLQTGILIVNASSQMPAAVPTHADATTSNPAVTLGNLLPLLSLNAQTVRADATIGGTCGSTLTATGSTIVTNAVASGTVGLGLTLPPNPAPNTVLLNRLGVRIVLNEQIQSGDGRTTENLTVNAIHITLQNSLLSALGLLTGDIVISHAHADVECPAVTATSADLSLIGSAAPSPVVSGGTLQYHFTVTNQGPNPATGVTLTDVLPAGLTGVSITPSQGSCSQGPPVSCNLGTLAAGQSVQVTVSSTVSASQGTLVSTATVASGVTDPNAGNNSVTLSTQVQGVASAQADLSLSGSLLPQTLSTGATAQLNFTVTNQGPNPAPGVVLSAALPAGLSGRSVTPSQGTCTLGPPLSCNLGTLAAGQTVTVGVTAAVTATQGSLVTTATVASGATDPNLGNNSVTLTGHVLGSNITGADIGLTATSSAPSVQVGKNVRCIFTFTNNGPATATSVTMPLSVSGRFTIVSDTASQGSCSVTEPLVCNLGTLASGGRATVDLTFSPDSAGTVTCEGTATSSVTDPSPANNTASAVINVTAGPTTPTIAAGACRIDAVPAATLLFPYFEVDLDDPNGATTLISINNAGVSTQLAQVTLWSDWGIPTLSFTLQLTGYDVQTINLRDVIGSGVLPSGGTGCAGATVSGPLSAATVGHLQAWHTGRQSPLQGTCAASPRSTNLATGYITVDAVNRCTTANPTTSGYFAANGTGIASDNNVLWGDLILVNADENLADGDPAVHILAEPGVFKNHYSFYGSFVNGTGADDRQPLGTSYASRYVSGGAFDGGTQLIIWRDAKVAHPTALTCGQEPARMTMGGTAFDEEENASLVAASTTTAPWSTQKVQLGGGEFPLANPFGWLDIDLWHPAASSLFGNVAQGWVTTIMVAQQRYSVGLRAIRLDSACDF